MKIYIITAHYIEDTMWSKAFSSIEKCNEFVHKHWKTKEEFSEDNDVVEIPERFSWSLWLYLTIDNVDNMELEIDL